MSESDDIYAKKRSPLGDFSFDADVARVFPDMIRRSVPGYETIVFLIGCIAGMHAREGSNVYDLGCSLGASTLSMHSRIDCPGVHYFCVDNSVDMLKGCTEVFGRQIPESDYTLVHENVESVEITNASVVVMNFTLQFVDSPERDALVRRIHDGMLDGGVLILSEKVRPDDAVQERFMMSFHDAFKLANGYSGLEISQKRTALERVMKLDSPERHRRRLVDTGFDPVHQWFQGLNFRSFVAIRADTSR